MHPMSTTGAFTHIMHTHIHADTLAYKHIHMHHTQHTNPGYQVKSQKDCAFSKSNNILLGEDTSLERQQDPWFQELGWESRIQDVWSTRLL